MKVNLAVEDPSGRLQQIEGDADLETIPRIGERICFGSRRVYAEVLRIEYLLPLDGGDALIAVILDRAPEGGQAG